MKSLSHFLRSGVPQLNCGQRLHRLFVHLGIAAAALGVIGATAHGREDFIAHEWGTFTSVQGADGILLEWRTTRISELPEFVYNWEKPGLKRPPPLAWMVGKGGLTALQRMETPVIYFYSDTGLTADVTVRFPRGAITEWYPQAAEITSPNSQPIVIMTSIPGAATNGSLIHWPDVRVLPADQNESAARLIPTGERGNHYFAARETDSALLRVSNRSPTNCAGEYEKFLFYRGAGSFATPLKVTTSDEGIVSVENTGTAPLAHLFLLDVRDGVGEWSALAKLEPGTRETFGQLAPIAQVRDLPSEQLTKQIRAAMEAALLAEGLFPREAQAMVNTWSKSWFAEDGMRVFYILPRAWTDELLPLQIMPQPQQLVRVMVGRAEIIPPTTQKEFANQIVLARAGDAQANVRFQAMMKQFGRFAGPAYRLATDYLAREQKKAVAEQARK